MVISETFRSAYFSSTDDNIGQVNRVSLRDDNDDDDDGNMKNNDDNDNLGQVDSVPLPRKITSLLPRLACLHIQVGNR